MKSIHNLLVSLLLVGCFAVPSFAQTPNSAYTIQQDDWLSKVAQRAYDNTCIMD